LGVRVFSSSGSPSFGPVKAFSLLLRVGAEGTRGVLGVLFGRVLRFSISEYYHKKSPDAKYGEMF
jgi:hypothetical protein